MVLIMLLAKHSLVMTMSYSPEEQMYNVVKGYKGNYTHSVNEQLYIKTFNLGILKDIKIWYLLWTALCKWMVTDLKYVGRKKYVSRKKPNQPNWLPSETIATV